MTEQETINNDVQIKLSLHDEKFNSVMSKVDATNGKIDNLIAEMRDRDNQRHAEIAELRESIKEIYTTTDSKIDSIRQSIQTMQNQNVVVIIGVIAIAVAVFLK